MDFRPDETTAFAGSLAGEVFARHTTQDRLRDVDSARDAFDGRLWGDLARADLLGTAITTDGGGAGMGFMSACAVVERSGWTAAPVALWAELAAALAVDRFEVTVDGQRMLHAFTEGRVHLALGMAGAEHGDPSRLEVRATPAGDDWRLDGLASFVVGSQRAAELVVAAAHRREARLFRVPMEARGVSTQRQITTAGDVEQVVALEGAAAVPLGGADAVAWALARAQVLLCALQSGLVSRAVAMTAAYTSDRHQFGRPLATFQAVQQRLVDAHLDAQAISLTAWRAAWALERGEAAEAVAVAKFWASEGAARAMTATLHLHGGMGVDRTYPLHRYFLRSKQAELALGGATSQLARLGDLLAAGQK